MTDTLILQEPNAYAASKARQLGLKVYIGNPLEASFDRALIVGRATIPWDLVPAGFHFLERWDAACPLWRYGVLAADLGTEAERAQTRVLIRDLRVMVYAPELLFVRRSTEGMALLGQWRQECGVDGEPRLAFLRALYQVKPLFCALPANWLAEARSGVQVRHGTTAPQRSGGLINVEIAPGQFVRCFASEAEKVKKRLLRNRMNREERRRDADHD